MAPSSAFGTGSATFSMGSAGSELLKLGKPGKYSGGSGFLTWRDSVVDYVKLMDKRLSDAMTHIETHLNSVTDLPQPVDDDDRARSETLRYMLRSLTVDDSAAQAVVLSAPAGNGLMSWLLLIQEYGGRDDATPGGLLTAILNFDFGKNLVELKDRFKEYERLYRELVGRVGTGHISDAVRRERVMSGVPEPLRQHLQLCASRATTYDEVRTIVSEFLRVRFLLTPST